MKNVSKANRQRAMKMQLQRFAAVGTTPTTPGGAVAANSANNQMGVRMYRPAFVRILSAIFKKKAYFGNFFDGLQTYDDITDNETVFTLKVNNTPVTNKHYDIDPNSGGFGDGTGQKSRFGPMQEITYKSLAVPYTWDYGWHEGIDRKTVNMDESVAVADRLEAQAKFKIDQFNKAHGTFIATTATAITTKAAALEPTQAEVVKAFDEAFTLFTNLEVSGTWRAYVKPEVWKMIVNNDLATNDAKAAGVSVAENTVYKFKGFILELVPTQIFQAETDLTYFTVDQSAHAFTGISTARTIEAQDFDGRSFQGAARAGEYIIEDNKVAVKKFEGTKP